MKRSYDAVVLASGGVDSAAAMALLRDRGLKLLAVTMLLPQYSSSAAPDGGEGGFEPCRSSAEAAAAMCARLAIPHAVVDIRDAFMSCVVDAFAAAYVAGLTPNPCVGCNARIKFGLMREWARANAGVDVLATGHYVKLEMRGGIPVLRRFDLWERDQSYFLYRLPRPDLGRTLFPLADFPGKAEVRAYAESLGLAAARQKDSQDVCFLPEGDYRPLVAGKNRPGPLLDPDGNEVGQHDGRLNFTIGQRKGLKKGFKQAMYVLGFVPERNAVIIGPRERANRRLVEAGNIVMHLPEECAPGTTAYGKIRSGGPARQCRVVEASGSRLAVEFAEDVFAPTPGQHLVLYDKEGYVLGGGEII